MKAILKLATIFAVGLFFTVSQAIAAPTWSIDDSSGDSLYPGDAYLDILNISGENDKIYMTLNGDVTTGNSFSTYQVNFTDTYDVNKLFAIGTDTPDLSFLAFKFMNNTPYFTGSIDGTSGSLSSGGNVITWDLHGKTPSGVNWVAGLTTLNNVGIVDRVGPAAATPIPGAIWLLGSGIMGLVGLKRRNLGMAAA